jgi:hypothetical protein
MNRKLYFYEYYINLVNPLCSKIMSVFDITMLLSMSILGSLRVSHLPVQGSTCIATVTQKGKPGQGSLTEGDGSVQLISMVD